MQNAFPLPVAAISQGESTTGDARKTERGTKLDEPGTGRFESFLVACAQPEAGQSGVGDSPSDLPFPSLTLPVLQDAETEEPLAQTGDMPLFSRSISAPVTFAKDEERGTGRLSEQKAMEEIFPDPDMERLRSLLSRMQDRYAASLRGDGHEAVSVEADKPDENAASGDSSDVRPEGSGVEPEVRKTQDVSGEEKKASIHAGSILSTLSRVHGIRFDASVTEGSGAEEEDRVSSPVSSYPENDVSRFPQETTPEETMERLRSMLSRTQERHEAFLLNEKLQGEKPGYGDISVEAEKVTETDKVTEADKADENAAPAVFWGVYPEDGGVGPDRDREISDVSGEEKKASIMPVRFCRRFLLMLRKKETRICAWI
ncbi:MAG: hypothetical protein LBQ90_03330 [Synergistaceae bacterium]|jgi:hypothetical protein|nr:hypothetical protein [Synergistaceae bacterium]